MKYDIKNKNIKIDGEEYEAHMVSNHGSLNGIIVHTIDANYDGYSNISDYKTTIYILKKNSKKWELFYHGDRHNCPITTDGYFNILAELESKENIIKEKIRDSKNNIAYYKEEIKRLNGYIKQETINLKKLKIGKL